MSSRHAMDLYEHEHRDVIMALLKEVDSEGVERRKKRSLTRRTYFSKVKLIFHGYVIKCF